MATQISIRYPPELIEGGARQHIDWLLREDFGIEGVQWVAAEGIDDFVINNLPKNLSHDALYELLWAEGVWDGCNA
jgi:hypothetical protein